MIDHRQRLVQRDIDADALQPEWCHQNEALCYVRKPVGEETSHLSIHYLFCFSFDNENKSFKICIHEFSF